VVVFHGKPDLSFRLNYLQWLK